MLVAYKYRLYPNKEQQEYFAKTFGCVRFIYNRMLSDKINYYKETKQKLNNTPAQYKKKFEWLKEVDSLALANAQMNLQTAYNNFFKRPEVGFPKFKSKKNNHYSYTTNNQGGNIYVSDKYIKLPKIGLVKVKKHREFDGLIKSVTVSKVPSGKYYVSVLVKQEDIEKLPECSNTLGIDLGIKEFAITSNGEMIENPKFLRQSEDRLRKLQKDLSRTKKGSKNRNKCRIKVAKQHEKIANQRDNYLHNITKELVEQYDVIKIEDLKAKNLMKNHKLARAIVNQSWRKLRLMLEYKCAWYGKRLVTVNSRKTSQICSNCGYDDGKHTLDIRQWTCPNCGTSHDRDINAAKNILAE